MQSFRRTIEISRRSRAIVGAAALSALTIVGLGGAHRGDAATVDPDSTAHLAADLSARKLTLYLGDSVVATYKVAVGRDSKPTPAGTFYIHRIVWNPAWIPPDSKWAQGKKPEAPGAAANPMKLVKIFFKEPDYYIHGTGDVESLGDAASHGCLRMDPDDAYRVARYVMEHGGQPRDESWFWRVLHFRSETKTVMLDHPIELTVTD